jgi:hypothetical protein
MVEVEVGRRGDGAEVRAEGGEVVGEMCVESLLSEIVK